MRWIVAFVVGGLAVSVSAQEEKPAEAPEKAASDKTAKPKADEGEATNGDVTVVEGKFGTGVKDRTLVGEATSFKADVGKVYCWTKVEGPEDSEIKHVWYRGDQKVSEVVLKLKFKSVRTWSFKTIPADGTGDWKVDVVGPKGSVVKSLTFKIE